MPVTVTHALSATTPDDPAYEIRPSHWNSGHAITLNILATEVTQLFSNKNGVSFGLDGTNITGSIAAGGAPGSVIAGTETLGLGAVSFSNDSGVSFGLNAGTLTASVKTDYQTSGNYLTTARASNDAIGLNSALTANGVSVTANSSGLSLNFPAFLTTAALSNHSHGNPTLALTNLTGTTASASNGFTLSLSAAAQGLTSQSNQNAIGSNGNFDFQSISFSNANGVSFGTSAGSAIFASHNGLTSQSNQNALAANGNFNFQTLSFSNGGGVSFITSAGSAIVGSVATTYRASNDAIGLNTAQSNVTWTVNSSGISFDARGYAGTGLSLTNATATLNSLGLQLSVGAAGGGGTLTFSASSNTTLTSTGTFAASAMIMRGLGIASIGFSNGEILVSVPAGGGAGDGGVFAGVSNVGNTAGSTGTVSTGNFVLVGSNNITLSQSTGGAGSAATVSIIGPSSSSLVAASGLSISTNGATITIGAIQASFFRQAGQITQAGTLQGNSLVSIQPFVLPRDVVLSNVLIAASFNVATAANNSSAYQDVSISGVIYTRNVSTLSSVASFSNSLTRTWSSNVSQTVTGVAGLTASLAQTTLSGGEYWIAFHVSTTNSATGGAATTALTHAISMILSGSIGSAANNVKAWGGQTADSMAVIGGQGLLSSGATRATLAFSDIVVTGTRGFLAPIFFELRNGTFQL